MCVQPAFLLGGLLPPPAAVPLVIVRADRTCARLTADAHETFVVQGVVRYSSLTNEIPDIGGRPRRERVELDDRVRGPLRVRADLNYWALPQYVADELLGKNELKVDVVQMETISKEIPLASRSVARRGR